MFILIALLMLNSYSGKSEEMPLSLDEIRKTFRIAVESETKTQELLLHTGSATPLRQGYTGAATMLMARHTLNPMAKLNYFEKGKTLLEDAIQRDPQNIELRFLRFCIQSNIPALLAYHHNKPEDYSHICNALSKLHDNNLRQMIHDSNLFTTCP